MPEFAARRPISTNYITNQRNDILNTSRVNAKENHVKAALKMEVQSKQATYHRWVE